MNRITFSRVLGLIVPLIFVGNLFAVTQYIVIVPFAVSENKTLFLTQLDEKTAQPTISFYTFKENLNNKDTIKKKYEEKVNGLFAKKPLTDEQEITHITVTIPGTIYGSTQYDIFFVKFNSLENLIQFQMSNRPAKVFSLEDIQNPQKMEQPHLLSFITYEIIKFPEFKKFLNEQVSVGSEAALLQNLSLLNSQLRSLLAHITKFGS